MQKRTEAIAALKQIVHDAHEDSRKRLRDLLGESLDPLGENSAYPVNNYPQCLHPLTLKGYFGEIFAGIIVEHFRPHNEDKWEIPAYLFRHHLEAFRQLEQLHQDSRSIGIIPGRTGDDCLAFKRDDTGKITHSLVCEAKCTNGHDYSNLLMEAHEKISEPNLKPLDLLQLIEILKSYDDNESKLWVNELRRLQLGKNPIGYERCDLVSYVCGSVPRLARQTSWIHPPSNMPSSYTGKRRLETVEIHLHDVEGLIARVYDKPQYMNNSNSSKELDGIWKAILSILLDTTIKSLLKDHCTLLGYDNNSAYIGINDIAHIRDVQNISDKIKEAFVKSKIYVPPEKDPNKRTKHINLEFRVAAEGSNDDSN